MADEELNELEAETEDQEIEVATDEADGETGERDWEADARAMGWSPKAEFKGDKSHWIDAKSFVERGEQVMPILKAQNKALLKRMSSMEKTMRQAQEFFSKSEQRGYERAMAEIKAKQRQAVELGDTDAFDEAEAEMAELEREVGRSGKEEPSGADAAEAFIEFRAENDWYNNNKLLTDYADLLGRKTPLDKSGMEPDEYFEWIAEQVKDKFQNKYPEAFGLTKKPTAKPRSAVEAPSQVRPRAGSKTAADLPPDAKRQMQRFVDMGLFKDLNAAAKEYFANAGA